MIPDFSDGGAQIQCIRLLNALQGRRDLELHLVRFDRLGVHDALLHTERLQIHTLPNRSHFDPRNIVSAARHVRRIRPAILLTWLHACDVYGYFVRALAPQTRWILTERDSHYPAALRYRLRFLFGRTADAIIANSAAGHDLWLGNRAKGPIHIVDNISPQPATGSEPQTPLVLCIGRLEPQKNVTAIAEAFCLLARRRPNVSFAFIGQGSLAPEVRQLIAAAGVSQRVELHGFSRNVETLLARASALVTMSHHEGMPNVVAEAAAAGTPILASTIPSHTEILGPAYPFLVEDRSNPAAIAAALDTLLDTPMPERHLDFARRRLQAMTAEAVANRYREIFSSLSGVAS